MEGTLRLTINWLQLFLIAAILSTSFMATQGNFNDLVTFKQYGLEKMSMLPGAMFIVVLLS